ncbi:MAG: ATP synthase F1 subunit delta [Alphaproteobacteria bacterium]|nr:ATP synthase F1 subunit delta [Alphaproteobacteria bacterium]
MNRTDALQISRRYATAIFALAIAEKSAAAVVAELSVLAAAMENNKNLSDALANPTLSHAKKSDILVALMDKANALSRRAVATVARGGRAGLLPVIAGQLRELLAKQQGEVEAVITSARTLSAATQKQLAQSLARATGKTVQLKLENDPAVLGGVRIELGSLRLDATLAGALANMRVQLLAATH